MTMTSSHTPTETARPARVITSTRALLGGCVIAVAVASAFGLRSIQGNPTSATPTTAEASESVLVGDTPTQTPNAQGDEVSAEQSVGLGSSLAEANTGSTTTSQEPTAAEANLAPDTDAEALSRPPQTSPPTPSGHKSESNHASSPADTPREDVATPPTTERAAVPTTPPTTASAPEPTVAEPAAPESSEPTPDTAPEDPVGPVDASPGLTLPPGLVEPPVVSLDQDPVLPLTTPETIPLPTLETIPGLSPIPSLVTTPELGGGLGGNLGLGG